MYKNKKSIRVVCLILAVLMVLGLLVVAIESLRASASDTLTNVETIEQLDGGELISASALTLMTNQIPDVESGYFYMTDPAKTPRDISGLIPHLDTLTEPIRVGVFYIYGSNNCLAFSHNINSVNGGLVFYSTYGDEYTFYHATDKAVTVMRDFSAKKNSSGVYYHTTTDNTHIIYHCVTEEPVALDAVDATVESFKEVLGSNATVFPLYKNGKAYIAVGTYSNKDASAADCSNMAALLGMSFVARTPNNTSISVVENSSGKILFKIDTENQALYVRPKQNGTSENYIKSSVGNIFDGTFEYKTTINGMYLVNVIDIEDYVKSVLPYEISASWPEESLKAFSIVVRSYTLSMLGKTHKQQDFDMCDETHCQAYRGRLRSTSKTDGAVNETKNVVLAYDSKVCETFYHAISGGVTESVDLVWGGKGYPYLISQEIPDEKYWNYTNGIWKFEVSEKELFEYIQSNSTVSRYVKHPITSVRVSKYTDAGYAYELEIIDESGTVSTFTKCDNVRTILSKYAKSARLTIGKSSEVVVNNGETMTIDPYNIIQTDKDGNTIISTRPVGKDSGIQVISGTGEISNLSVSESSTYVISGSGWGHGVGLSQYGARDMANNGYKWYEIALFFFPNAYLSHLSDLSVDILTPDGPVIPETPNTPEYPEEPDYPDLPEEDEEYYLPDEPTNRPIRVV